MDYDVVFVFQAIAQNLSPQLGGDVRDTQSYAVAFDLIDGESLLKLYIHILGMLQEI